MSFNAEQRDHMRWLGEQPPEKLAWCGWGPVGPFCCGSPSEECKAGKTLADKMKVWCPECHNVPRNGAIVHCIGCSHRSETPLDPAKGSE